MDTNLPYYIMHQKSTKINSSKPTEEELLRLIHESDLDIIGGASKLTIQLQDGELRISSLIGGPRVVFPHNCNGYKLPYSKDVNRRTVEWICMEWEHLCWMDFHYTPPREYLGSDPQTLDEFCVFYKNLRHKSKVTKAEKEFILKRALDLIYEEAKVFAERLNMPFHNLQLLSISNISKMANTDRHGSITYNANKLYLDADSIRQTLVHELCHSVQSGHAPAFSKVMEDAMLSLSLIPRPCAFSTKLDMEDWSGAHFPIGWTCPGYNFVTGIKGVADNRFLPKTSLWKKKEV